MITSNRFLFAALVFASCGDVLGFMASDPPLRLRGSRAKQATQEASFTPLDTKHQVDPIGDIALPANTFGSVKLRGTTTHGKNKDISLSLDKLEEHIKPHALRSGKQHSKQHHQVQSQNHTKEVGEVYNRNESAIWGASETDSTNDKPAKRDRSAKKPSKIRKKAYMLPTANEGHFSQALFEQLHSAPFDVYEDTLGRPMDEAESFPVFAMPMWHNTTGVFSAYTKSATPFIFENTQILLDWKNIYAASNGVSEDLKEYIDNSNFHSALIIGKTYGKKRVSSFLGLVISYYQYGVSKNVLVPFARIEDFFEDTSEHDPLDPTTKHLEMVALHELLSQKKANNTKFDAILSSRDTRKQRLEQLDITRFQKMFQILIRRTFMFSFGYADCVDRDPYELRSCLGDVYSEVLKKESGLRGALEEEMSGMLSDINDTFHSNVREACITVQGQGAGYFGSGSCNELNDLSSFVHASFASI